VSFNQNKQVIFQDIGLVDYKKAWDLQEKLFNRIIDKKLENRDKAETDQQITDNYLLFCQHPHVYTLGKSGDEKTCCLTMKG
jgi:lipoyl(octanoyl) transferase